MHNSTVQYNINIFVSSSLMWLFVPLLVDCEGDKQYFHDTVAHCPPTISQILQRKELWDIENIIRWLSAVGEELI